MEWASLRCKFDAGLILVREAYERLGFGELIGRHLKEFSCCGNRQRSGYHSSPSE